MLISDHSTRAVISGGLGQQFKPFGRDVCKYLMNHNPSERCVYISGFKYDL